MTKDGNSKNPKAYKAIKEQMKLDQLALDTKMKELKVEEQATKLQAIKETHEIEAQGNLGMYGTAKEPRKALSTFLRNKNKSDISLVSILDRKAAILIRITTTLVSAFIIFHDYIVENVPLGSQISTVLVAGMLVTLILSLLAAKPFGWIFSRVFKKEILPKHPNLEENIFYAVEPCTLEEYEDAMRKVILSQDLQLGNQIRANYMLTKNNGAKAVLLDAAYIVFLFTFIIVGAIFLFGKFSI